MKIGRRISSFIEECSVKCEIYLENREMLEVFLDTVNGQHFFCENISTHLVRSGFNSTFVLLRSIDLTSPSGVSIAGCPDKETRVQRPEMEFFPRFRVDAIRVHRHKS
jgi:hypothetical protein